MEILDCIPAIPSISYPPDIEKAEKEYNSIKTNKDKLQWIEKHNDLKNMEKEIEKHLEKDLEVRFNRQYYWCKKVDM
ncbi:21715_t:CDS:2 [Rhizophagus irregularis]|nr:21715_t:CDS:2 [Rhizophagus irregularis]